MQNTEKCLFVISHLGHSLIQRIICNITKTSFLCFLIIGIFLCCSLKCEWCSVLDVISRKESRTVDHFLCRPLHTHTQAAHNAGKLQNHISNASQLFMGQFWGSQSSDCFKTITTSSGSFVDQCLWRPTDTHAVLIRQWGKVIVRSQSWFCPILWTQ